MIQRADGIVVANTYEYRMAIEDDDIKDREHWTAVSNEWYAMAADRAPKTGRFYHHLAILARPNVLKQLFFYGKALVVPIPFASALESIMTLFRPLLKVGPIPSRLSCKTSSSSGTGSVAFLFPLAALLFFMCNF